MRGHTSRIPDIRSNNIVSPPRVELNYRNLKFEDTIGSGGYALVSKALVSESQGPNKVAIKEPIGNHSTLSSNVVEQFLTEAETWKMIDSRERNKPRWRDSEHIVGIVAKGDDLPWIAIEYMDGGNLADRLVKNDDQISIGETLWVARSVWNGVERPCLITRRERFTSSG